MFNLNHFYKYGFTVGNLELDKATQLLNRIQKESFIEATGVFDVYASSEYDSKAGKVIEPPFNVSLREKLNPSWIDVVHPDIWDKGVNGMKTTQDPFMSYPEDLTDFWKEHVGAALARFNRIYGTFDYITMLAHRYRKGQGLGWHHDLTDSTWLNCILYLGDDDFTFDDGGYLEIGETPIDKEGLPTSSVLSICKIPPKHGTIVLMDNRNPRLLHRVPALAVDKCRYTLSCQFGYLENIIGRSFSKDSK